MLKPYNYIKEIKSMHDAINIIAAKGKRTEIETYIIQKVFENSVLSKKKKKVNLQYNSCFSLDKSLMPKKL